MRSPAPAWMLLGALLLPAAWAQQAPAPAEAATAQAPAAAPGSALPDQSAAQAAQLRELTRERDDARQQLLTEQAKTPPWMSRMPPRVQAALPGVAIAVSLLVLLLAAWTAWTAWNGRVMLSAEYREVHRRLREAEAELARRRSLEPAAASGAGGPETAFAVRNATKAAPRPRAPRAVPAAPVEEPVTLVAAPETASTTQERADPDAAFSDRAEAFPPRSAQNAREMSGEPAGDYEVARFDPEGGTARLRERYGTVWGLSCTNLEQARRSGGALHFAESPRPTFLLLRSGGELLAVPAPDRDPLAMRQSLEGVFLFPDAPDGPIVLTRPAAVRQAGAEWLLERPGEFALA